MKSVLFSLLLFTKIEVSDLYIGEFVGYLLFYSSFIKDLIFIVILPLKVNFIAFVTRFIRICFNLNLSVFKILFGVSIQLFTIKFKFFFCIGILTNSVTSLINSSIVNS